ITPGAGFFGGAFYQGIYQLNRGGERQLIARNLLDRGESDLRTPTPVAIGGGSPLGASASVLFSFWPYLLIVSLALLLLEWFISPRMAFAKPLRVPAQAAQR
ncbi:MAG: hypothetical protein ACXWW4_17065, partial [Candidatus Binatia bacterium]